MGLLLQVSVSPPVNGDINDKAPKHTGLLRLETASHPSWTGPSDGSHQWLIIEIR